MFRGQGEKREEQRNPSTQNLLKVQHLLIGVFVDHLKVQHLLIGVFVDHLTGPGCVKLLESVSGGMNEFFDLEDPIKPTEPFLQCWGLLCLSELDTVD